MCSIDHVQIVAFSILSSQSIYIFLLYMLNLHAIIVLQDLDDIGVLTALQKLVEKRRVAENVVSLLNKVLHNKYPKFSSLKKIPEQELLTWNFWPEIIKIFGKIFKCVCSYI